GPARPAVPAASSSILRFPSPPCGEAGCVWLHSPPHHVGRSGGDVHLPLPLMPFFERLRALSRERRTMLCVGLDPDPERIDGAAAGAPMFLRVAAMAERANGHGNVGLVVGATAPSAVVDVRKASTLPFLIPGIGAQGGDVSASVRAAWNGDPASCLISVSRAILFDRNPSRAAAGIRAEINAVIGKLI